VLFLLKLRWKFAFKCVLEEDVRRIHKNWDWNHMHSHRKLVKEYSVLYKQKLESKKPSILTLNRISELEKHLDVMNIIVTRQRVENEVRFLHIILILFTSFFAVLLRYILSFY